MTRKITQLWTEQDGVLAFEWTLILTLLTIGIVSGVAAVRDATIDELGDTAQVMLAVDQSYTITFPLQVAVHTATTNSASDTAFTDALIYADCDTTLGAGIPLIGQIDQSTGNPFGEVNDFFPDGA
jgi:Flp pilus assembly pilin Flp